MTEPIKYPDTYSPALRAAFQQIDELGRYNPAARSRWNILASLLIAHEEAHPFVGTTHQYAMSPIFAAPYGQMYKAQRAAPEGKLTSWQGPYPDDFDPPSSFYQPTRRYLKPRF